MSCPLFLFIKVPPPCAVRKHRHALGLFRRGPAVTRRPEPNVVDAPGRIALRAIEQAVPKPPVPPDHGLAVFEARPADQVKDAHPLRLFSLSVTGDVDIGPRGLVHLVSPFAAAEAANAG